MDSEKSTIPNVPEESPQSEPETVVEEVAEANASADVETPEAASTETTVAEASTAAITPVEDDDSYNKIEPRGAYAFVIAIGVFYFAYWFITYFEVFILRGG